MKVSDFFDMISNAEIDDMRVKELEKIYGLAIPMTIKSIVSIADEPIFVEEYRVLSFAEIADADDDLEVNFSERHLLPVVDCGDNDFIVYDLGKECWTKFNIIELCAFSPKKDLAQIMG